MIFVATILQQLMRSSQFSLSRKSVFSDSVQLFVRIRFIVILKTNKDNISGTSFNPYAALGTFLVFCSLISLTILAVLMQMV